MAKNIEMNHLNSDGSYESLCPKTMANITYPSSSILSSLGLSENSNVDDAFNVLSRFHKGLGNEYVWEKYKSTIINTPTYKTAEYENSESWNTSYSSETFYCGNTFDIVKRDGVDYFRISNYTTVIIPQGVTSPSQVNPLKGKYYTNRLQIVDNTVQTTLMKFIPSNATISVQNNIWEASLVIEYSNPLIRTETVINERSYLNSPNSNAYPPAVSDGYTYKALGQLGAKAQIEAGSYVGNGTSGADNPNVVTLGFEAKLFMMTYMYYNDANQGNLLNSMFVPFSLLPTSYKNKYGPCAVSNLANCYTKRDGNTLYWYVTSGDQFNKAGWTYNYLAIG